MTKKIAIIANGKSALIAIAAHMGSDELIPVETDGASEAPTEYDSPCCEGHGVYAHFQGEALTGFQCTCCGSDFDTNYFD